MTPLDIEVLIHCHVSPSPHPRHFAPGVEESLRDHAWRGLIEEIAGQPGSYRTTGRGKAHVAQICGLDLPMQAWIGADGKVIKE